MIARWIRETFIEYDKAKANQNVFKMIEMQSLADALKKMRDDLTISTG